MAIQLQQFHGFYLRRCRFYATDVSRNFGKQRSVSDVRNNEQARESMMQKFDTPARISAVLDVAAGRIQFIAADRADTTVEVLPANPSESRDVQTAERPPSPTPTASCGSTPPSPRTARPLRTPGGHRPAARRLPHRGQGRQLRAPRRRPPWRRRLRRRVPRDQDHEAASVRLAATDGDVEVGRLNGPRRSAPQGATSGSPRPCAARSCSAPIPATFRSRRRRRLGRPGRRHRLRPHQQRPQEHGTADLDIRATTSHGDITARSL